MPGSSKITFLPQQLTVEASPGATVLEAATANNIILESFCNGNGKCGKCLVKVVGQVSTPHEEEKKKLGSKLAAGFRLACQARVAGDMEVVLPDQQEFTTIQEGHVVKYPFDPTLLPQSNPGERLCAVGVDIGTTSVVVTLVDLQDGGRELATASCLNPQTRHGGDIITRITFANERPVNVTRMQQLIVNALNALLAEACGKVGVPITSVCHLAIAANPTMLHLLMGINPISIAVAPYQPVFLDYTGVPAQKLGIQGRPEAMVCLLPSLSAFVGADILAGLVATGFHKLQQPALYIDIGTNGEIVANVNGRLCATSSAAGPALEGMNIQFGCRAEDGAISEVVINDAGEVYLAQIGTARRKGICGSGLVDLVAELVRTGVIQPSGSFTEAKEVIPALGERLIEFEGNRAFVVDKESMIVLTQRDVRQVQLAKGAMAAAINILFNQLEWPLEKVEKVWIAGAFGFHLKEHSLRALGLLPAGLANARVEFVGNAAKEGALLCVTSRQAMDEIIRLQKQVLPLELSNTPAFQENFVDQLGFPQV